MAWLFSIGLILATAALAAWGLSALFKPRPVMIPIERQDQVIDLGGPPPTAPAPKTAGGEEPLIVVRNPSWITPPRPDFPDKAVAMGVNEGTVAVRCKSSVQGRLEECVIHAESPAGAGFGEASLAATRDARLSPRMVDGKPTTGAVSYTNRFRMD